MNAFESGLEKAGIPHQITVYEGQPHAFVRDKEQVEAGGSAAEAWNEMLTFLDENLKKESAQSIHNSSLDYETRFAWRYYLALAFEHAFGGASHVH